MPGPSLFLRGFNVHKDLTIANYKITNINIGHDTITRYHKYSYPMTITFQSLGNGGDPNALLRSFQQYVSGDKIIDSEYGNPYSCNFGILKISSNNGNTVVLESLGSSVRVYN
jgi:hypothetical protein